MTSCPCSLAARHRNAKTSNRNLQPQPAPSPWRHLDHALPVLRERVRTLLDREAHRDFVRLCIGPGNSGGVARRLARHGHWSVTLYIGDLTTWTAHPITITTHHP
ncbi:hypothetical protein ACWEQL_03170 [Kitasatospora sp. NPDC004240]